MNGDDLFVEGATALKKPAPIPPEVAPTEPCKNCGSTEWWVGTPSICKKCKSPSRPLLLPPEPAQESLPGFPSDPVPHAPAGQETDEDRVAEIRQSIARLKRFARETDDASLRVAIDVVVARLEPEFPPEVPAPAPGEPAPQASLFELSALPEVPTAVAAEPIRVYVHFERAADVAEFGRRVGMVLGSGTRRLRYSRDHAEAVSGDDSPIPAPSGERDKTMADVQTGLFGSGEWWHEHWRGMPEFDQRDLAPVYSIEMEFNSWEDVEHFEAAVDQPVPRGPKRTPSIWFPEAEIGHFAGKSYNASPPMVPKYPVFIISRGRWETRHTSRALEKMGVPYRIVVEPQERDNYAQFIDPAKILVLPFTTDGTQGATPARNFCWDTAAKEGAARHWVLDDNIDGFYRLNKNLKTPVGDGTIFRAAEEFVDRYTNVGQAGFHYFMFASRKTKLPPFYLNSRVYSCMLIRTDVPFRFRGRFNDDTDMSLRILKAGYATVLFSAFLAFKMTTQTVKGGLADTLYKIEDARRIGSEALRALHPDVTKVTKKWGRWHHHVDYRGFRSTQLIPRDGAVPPEGVNNFGMSLIEEK